jgi:hypothetical protein
MKNILLKSDAAEGGKQTAPLRGVEGGVKVRALATLAEEVNGKQEHFAKGEVFLLAEKRIPALGKLIELVAFVLLFVALAFVPQARAQQYESITLGGFSGGTNIIPANTFTNISAITNATTARFVTLTKFDEFVFTLKWTPMNGASNQVVVVWEKTTGTNRPAAITGATNVNRSWFITLGADATNSAGEVVFETNITVGAFGYWWPAVITNTANVVLSNVVMKATVKPKRNG